MLPFLYEPNQTRPETFAQARDLTTFGEHVRQTLSGGLTLGSQIGLELSTKPDLYRDLFGAAERQTMFANNAFSENAAREEAYDRRIKTVKDATGVELQNPLRGDLTEAMIRRAQQGDLGEPVSDAATAAGMFENKLAELRDAHPDKLDRLTFGNLDEEARAIAKGAEDEYARVSSNPKIDPIAGLATQFAGAFWGQRRDPIFVGSMFVGPTTAAGRTAVARIASSALNQGLYNAGVTALEQPAVQGWRSSIGVKSGLLPAVEDVGMAFLFGAIPGAAFRGVHELSAASKSALRRTLAGTPEPGDADAAIKATGADVPPHQEAAIRLGADMEAADRAVRPPPPARNVSPELHDDLSAAALRHADDPLGSPSPEAVAVERQMSAERVGAAAIQTADGTVFTGANHGEAFEALARTVGGEERIPAERVEGFMTSTGRFVSRDEALQIANQAGQIEKPPRDGRLTAEDLSPGPAPDPEIAARVAEAQPRTAREAQMAASEALEDIGNRSMLARLREQMAAEQAERGVQRVITEPAAAARSSDPLKMVPIARADGTMKLISEREVAKMAERDMHLADIVGACK